MGCVAGKLDTETEPSTVILPALSVIGIAAWSEAITTGAEFALVAEPFGLLGLYAIL